MSRMSQITGFYKPEEEIFCNDGREAELLSFIKAHPRISEMRGSPQAVLDAIDEYGRTQNFLMNVGQEKGTIVTDLIAKQKPQCILELGGYVGYSAILFGDALWKVGGQRYVSLELSSKFATVARELVELAGLSSVVTIIEGPCRTSLRNFRQDDSLRAWDIIFFDHAKEAYLPDLKLCEELNLVAPGTTIIADDMISPGNPQYSDYVRASSKSKKVIHDLYKGAASKQDSSLGNPRLVYKTSTFQGLQPSGLPDAIEISRCEGMEVNQTVG